MLGHYYYCSCGCCSVVASEWGSRNWSMVTWVKLEPFSLLEFPMNSPCWGFLKIMWHLIHKHLQMSYFFISISEFQPQKMSQMTFENSALLPFGGIYGSKSTRKHQGIPLYLEIQEFLQENKPKVPTALYSSVVDNARPFKLSLG